MFATSHIELSKGALEKNFAFLRKQFPPQTLISSVVKGNAYGHGIEEFVPLAENCGQDHFSVFSADEAYRVLQASAKSPTVVIMGDAEKAALEWAIENAIEFFVFDAHRLKTAVEIAQRLKKKAVIHVELETGMNRTGFQTEQLDALLAYVQDHQEYIRLRGLCTHFAGAESVANYVRVRTQFKRFRQMSKVFKARGIGFEQYHTACSAASMRYPETQMDMVRIGILQYGFWPSRETFIEYTAREKDRAEPLHRLISWKSHVMNVKPVKTGEFIGYGTTYLAQRDMIIAAVPVGYSHGFSRSLSNTGRVLVRGHRVPVIGLVNMNAMVIDVTDAPGVEKGDEVVLIGRQGELEITVSSFGELSEQLNYELLTRLPQDIPRIITA